MFNVPISKLGSSAVGEEGEGVRVGELIQDNLFWAPLPVFLILTQAFHKQVVLDTWGRVMNYLGDLTKDLKFLTRNMYVDKQKFSSNSKYVMGAPLPKLI